MCCAARTLKSTLQKVCGFHHVISGALALDNAFSDVYFWRSLLEDCCKVKPSVESELIVDLEVCSHLVRPILKTGI